MLQSDDDADDADAEQDPAERAWFRNLPTSFQLPRDSVDKLRAVARRLLAEDPEFRKLMKALDGK